MSREVGDRRLRVAGAEFRLRSFHSEPGGSAWSLRRLQNVRAELADVEWDDLVADAVVVECDEVELGPRVAASGLRVTASLPLAAVRALLARSGSSWEVDLVDDEARLRWFPGVDVVVRPDVVDQQLRFTPVGLRSAGVRLPVPVWLPPPVVAPPPLPGGLALLDVAVRGDAVDIRAGADRWTSR